MQGKIEVEEMVSKERFIQFLRGLADSMEESTDFQTTIQGRQVSIPPQGEMKVDFESKEKGGELDLELKWRTAA